MPVHPDPLTQEETPAKTVSNPGPQNVKSSDEILSELFGAFNATPPPINKIKQEKELSDSGSKKHKKHSKKKSKKEKKKRRSSSSDSTRSEKKRREVKKIKKEKSDSKSNRKSSIDSKEKKRKLGKYSASDSDSDDDDGKSKKKKTHSSSKVDEKNCMVPTNPVKTEPVNSKLSSSCIISSLKESILKEAVGKIVDNVIDSSKLISSILPQKVKIKVEPPSSSIHLLKPVIKQEPVSPVKNKDSDKARTKGISVPGVVTGDIPVPELNPEDIPIPGQLNAPKPDEIPIPKDKVGHSDQQESSIPVADVFVEDLLDSGVNARDIAFKKDPKASGGKITIQNLKFSQVYEQTVKQIEEEAKRKAEKYEEGELSESSEEPVRSPTPSGVSSADESPANKKEEKVHVTSKSKKHRHHHKKDRHRHRNRSHDQKRSTSKENHRSHSRRDRSLSREKRRHRDRIRSRSLSKSRDLRDLIRSRSRDHRRSRSRDRKRSRSRDRRRSRSKERKRSRSKERRKSRSRERQKSRDRSKSKERSSDKSKSSDRKRDESSRKDEKTKDHRSKEEKIDKRKLLEIARKNALSMLKTANPGAIPEQTKVSLTAGGKTVNELTDFCKLLSKKDADGHESISSDESHSSGDEREKAFHHPFQLRDRPNSIVLNIRNSVALPTKSHQEKTAEQSRQLRLQFPVSSGQQHRSTENEWYPVSPKKTEPSTSTSSAADMQLAVVRPQRPKRVFKDTPDPPPLDIGSIVSQRLNAIRKLQENPKDGEALSLMSSAQQHMQTWAESKQDPPGTFTGSTGVKVLTQAELSSGYQAWARKDQLQTAAPVTGGMGMTLLQKMGWRPGEGLGKHKEGTLQPLMLSVKTDKKGLVAQEELPVRQPHQIVRGPPRIRTLEGKHPVSLLNEYCSRRRYGPPVFELADEVGPDHKKYFLFKVKVNGIEYKPAVGSPKKKQARAEAAEAALKAMGVLP